MKLWIDDVQPAPEGYIWSKSVDEAITEIIWNELEREYEGEIYVIDIDYDAGNYASDGGDYIRLLVWLEETGRNYPIHIHSINPVDVANMRRIIERNGWEEIK